MSARSAAWTCRVNCGHETVAHHVDGEVDQPDGQDREDDGQLRMRRTVAPGEDGGDVGAVAEEQERQHADRPARDDERPPSPDAQLAAVRERADDGLDDETWQSALRRRGFADLTAVPP